MNLIVLFIINPSLFIVKWGYPPIEVFDLVKEGEKAPKGMTEAWSWSPRGKEKKGRIVIYRRP